MHTLAFVRGLYTHTHLNAVPPEPSRPEYYTYTHTHTHTSIHRHAGPHIRNQIIIDVACNKLIILTLPGAPKRICERIPEQIKLASPNNDRAKCMQNNRCESARVRDSLGIMMPLQWQLFAGPKVLPMLQHRICA